MGSSAALQYLTSEIDTTIEQHYKGLLENGDMRRYVSEKYGYVQEKFKTLQEYDILNFGNDGRTILIDELNQLIN